MADAVAVEDRREYPMRQRRRDEERRCGERVEHHVAELARGGAALRQLQIVLDELGLRAGRRAAIRYRDDRRDSR